MDLNRKELLDDDRDYLLGKHSKLIVEIIRIKDVSESEKECVSITFKVLSEPYQSYILPPQRYYLTKRSHWRIRVLACACGLYTIKKDDSGKDVKWVHDDFQIKNCLNKTIQIDTRIEEYNGNERTVTYNEKEIIDQEEDKEDALQESELPPIKPSF